MEKIEISAIFGLHMPPNLFSRVKPSTYIVNIWALHIYFCLVNLASKQTKKSTVLRGILVDFEWDNVLKIIF